MAWNAGRTSAVLFASSIDTSRLLFASEAECPLATRRAGRPFGSISRHRNTGMSMWGKAWKGIVYGLFSQEARANETKEARCFPHQQMGAQGPRRWPSEKASALIRFNKASGGIETRTTQPGLRWRVFFSFDQDGAPQIRSVKAAPTGWRVLKPILRHWTHPEMAINLPPHPASHDVQDYGYAAVRQSGWRRKWVEATLTMAGPHDACGGHAVSSVHGWAHMIAAAKDP